VAHAWMPEAVRIRAETDGGALGGGAPRAVWLTLGSLAHDISVQSAAQRLAEEYRPCHLIWNPATGEMAQLISVLRAGCALGAPDRLDWTPARIQRVPENVNAEGRVCVQIGVLALAAEPFTDGPMIGVESIMSWLDSWGVSRRWPGGQPVGIRAGSRAVVDPVDEGAADGSRAVWARGGHFGASQVPGCAHVGPGAIDIHRLTGGGPHGLAVRTRELPAPFAAMALPIPALLEASAPRACRLRRRQVPQSVSYASDTNRGGRWRRRQDAVRVDGVGDMGARSGMEKAGGGAAKLRVRSG